MAKAVQHLRIAKWLGALSALTYFLLILGAAVRNLGAGLACPDWPLCFGKIIPHFDLKIFFEFFHRLVAGSVSLLLLGIVIYITMHKPLRSLLGRQCLLAVFLLASQVILGGLTVLKLLQSEIVTLHLGFGSLFFLTLLIMTMRAYRFSDKPHLFSVARDRKRGEPTHTWRWAVATLVIVYLQIILGGMVASQGAALACPDFPKCLGEWWPGLSGIVGVHMLHRIGALITFIMTTTFIVIIYRDKALPKHLKVKANLIAVTLAIQVCLGIANVLFRIPPALSITHLAVAEALLALVLITTYEIRHLQLRQTH